MFCKVLTAFTFAAVFMSSIALGQSATAKRAYKSALNGQELKKLSLYGHKWNIKRASLSDSQAGFSYRGQISHHLGLGRPDNQVYYRLDYNTTGVLKRALIKLGDWNYLEISKNYRDTIGSRYGTHVIKGNDVNNILAKIDPLKQQEWRWAAHKIVTAFAVQFGEAVQKKIAKDRGLLVWAAYAGPQYYARVFGEPVTVHKGQKRRFGNETTFSGLIQWHNRQGFATPVNYTFEMRDGVIQKIEVAFGNRGQSGPMSRRARSILNKFVGIKPITGRDADNIDELLVYVNGQPGQFQIEKILISLATRMSR